jgi:hypothetical protein
VKTEKKNQDEKIKKEGSNKTKGDCDMNIGAAGVLERTAVDEFEQIETDTYEKDYSYLDQWVDKQSKELLESLSSRGTYNKSGKF